MKKIIERTLFWFNDGDENVLLLNEKYFSLGNLLNRLLNEKYEGEPIQFINIYFAAKEKYEKYPLIPINHIHYYSKSPRLLAYHGLIDFSEFNILIQEEQNLYIWSEACKCLETSATTIKNDSLLEATRLAFEKGLSMGLNPDYKLIETDVVVYGRPLRAAVWVNFKSEGMYSKMTLEQNGRMIFEKQIDQANNGVEFFLEMYKKIEVKDNIIIIRGHRDVEYLPLSIPIPKEVLHE